MVFRSLNKNGPDFERNKGRILDKIDVMDASFLTTSPSALNFYQKITKIIIFQILATIRSKL